MTDLYLLYVQKKESHSKLRFKLSQYAQKVYGNNQDLGYGKDAEMLPMVWRLIELYFYDVLGSYGRVLDLAMASGFLGKTPATRDTVHEQIAHQRFIDKVVVFNAMPLAKNDRLDYLQELTARHQSAEPINTTISSNKKYDHRKMLFLYERDALPYSDPESDSYDKAGLLQAVGIDDVHAVAIGSSNASNSTYFTMNHDEADVVLFTDPQLASFLRTMINSIDPPANGIVLAKAMTTVRDDCLYRIFESTVNALC